MTQYEGSALDWQQREILRLEKRLELAELRARHALLVLDEFPEGTLTRQEVENLARAVLGESQ